MTTYKIIDAGVDFSQDIEFKKYLQDEKIMNLIFEIKDDEKTSEYKFEDWISVCKFANENDCLPLKIAILKSKNVTTSATHKIMDSLDYDEKFYTFLSNAVNKEIISELLGIYDIREIYNFLYSYGDHFSQNSIAHLCNLREDLLKKVDYYPYRLIKSDCPIIEKLEYLLDDNNELFKNGISEKMTSAIASNSNIPESIRNEAFKKGYVLLDINKFTNEMIEEIYKTCTESLFMINGEHKEEYEELKNEIHEELSFLMKHNFLSESHQIDFVEQTRCSPRSHNQTFNFIVTTTPYADVMKRALYVSDMNIINKISDNEFINCDVIKSALKIASSRQLDRAYITAVFNSATDLELTRTFFMHKDTSIYRAILTSCRTSDMVSDYIVKATKNNPHNEEFKFLRDLRTVVAGAISDPNRQLIMNYIMLEIFKNEKDNEAQRAALNSMTSTHRLILELKRELPSQWFLMEHSEFKLLRDTMNRLSEKYPKYKFICDDVLCKLDNLENDIKIVKKYPEIFTTIPNKTCHIGERLPFSKIDIDKLVNLTEDKKKEFIRDISKIENKDIDNLLYDMMTNKVNKIPIDCDEILINSYKLSPIFDAVDEKYKGAYKGYGDWELPDNEFSF